VLASNFGGATTDSPAPTAAAVARTPEAVAEQFLTYLRDGKYGPAYNLCTSDLQDELGGPEGLHEFLVKNDIALVRWSITDRNVGTDRAEYQGTATLSRSRTTGLEMVILKPEHAWQVAGIHFRSN